MPFGGPTPARLAQVDDESPQTTSSGDVWAQIQHATCNSSANATGFDSALTYSPPFFVRAHQTTKEDCTPGTLKASQVALVEPVAYLKDLVIVAMVQRELLPQADLTLAHRADTTPHGGHMLAEVQIEALHKRGVDLPAVHREHLLHGLQGAEHHAVTDPHQATASQCLDDLGVEELWPWQPAPFRHGTFGLTTRRLPPLAIVGEQGRHVCAKPVRHKERRTVGR